ncbi:MAG: flagellar biosynthesis protein FlgM [Deltaproteobacteria bacterium]|nr:flagellar biosynthesis protein FlgM [Deltaproteobacteria bacterium]
MKVNETSNLAPVRALRPAEPAEKVRSANQDKVSTEERERVGNMSSEAKEMAGQNRAARLQALEAQVQSGTYKPNAGRIAEQILADVELEVSLRSMLN